MTAASLRSAIVSSCVGFVSATMQRMEDPDVQIFMLRERLLTKITNAAGVILGSNMTYVDLQGRHVGARKLRKSTVSS